MCHQTQHAHLTCAAPCAATPVCQSSSPAPVLHGVQTARVFPVVAAKDGSFTEFPSQLTADADEALLHTYASFKEEPAIALSTAANTRRDDAWTLCLPVPAPTIINPTLRSVNYLIKYATTADAGNATLQTDVLLTTAALPKDIVSARQPLGVYRPGAPGAVGPRMVDHAAALCLATALAIKANAGGEQWSDFVDAQHVAPDVRVRGGAQLYVVLNVDEHSTFRTARSLSIEVSATWQKEEVELKARAEEARKAKEAADKEAQELAEKKAREAEEKKAREEEAAWRVADRQARQAEAEARAEDKKAREEERKFREEMRIHMEAERKSWVVVTKPSVEAAPAVADDHIQNHIKETMAKLSMQPCPQGYEFVKEATGYRCKGGSHFVSFQQLGMK
ncbi:hypothetical protein MVEN_02381200 [Mycena venus]|uniref:Uncharacterized protein n=1 Tax=Mycena venus TaxID=2733690 RepID=A0A8H6X2V6_9AGAR|nr:hypothetical protein MVEN_02381200 [Mycena venus]